MKNLADIFLEILSQFQDEETKIMANRMKAAIKNRDISKLLNISIVNALGQKSTIRQEQIDKAIEGIISLRHSEIDKQQLFDLDKELQKFLYKCFATEMAKILKSHFSTTGQLE
ncbi:MAG: hypothetical protein J6V30_00040 [Paludibacteraceae bacterium]|nr:hypothetical protein [Paludibacteraceae bacterium]